MAGARATTCTRPGCAAHPLVRCLHAAPAIPLALPIAPAVCSAASPPLGLRNRLPRNASSKALTASPAALPGVWPAEPPPKSPRRSIRSAPGPEPLPPIGDARRSLEASKSTSWTPLLSIGDASGSLEASRSMSWNPNPSALGSPFSSSPKSISISSGGCGVGGVGGSVGVVLTAASSVAVSKSFPLAGGFALLAAATTGSSLRTWRAAAGAPATMLSDTVRTFSEALSRSAESCAPTLA
mmetsp:Transcript_75965/g.201808  ORF Transcript_75965/g.201808 Transcript_75965/m.201808 type:complete len:240 (-) Transcript_75965:841-1560(-)